MTLTMRYFCVTFYHQDFRISKDIVVDNTKMPSNMDFWGMLALQMKNDE